MDNLINIEAAIQLRNKVKSLESLQENWDAAASNEKARERAVDFIHKLARKDAKLLEGMDCYLSRHGGVVFENNLFYISIEEDHVFVNFDTLTVDNIVESSVLFEVVKELLDHGKVGKGFLDIS